MYRILVVVLGLIATPLLGCWSPDSGWQTDFVNLMYTSMESISVVDTTKICCAVDDASATYLSPTSCLGYYGPLGPTGPLSTLGPIGSNTWSVSVYMDMIGDWSYFSQFLTQIGGPLSPDGPLGSNGAIAYDQFYGNVDPGKTLFASNIFTQQLRAFGIYSALGPIGPLGPLGALGPLGPLGAHGFSTDTHGNYVSNGSIIRTVDVNGEVFELYENYNQTYAECMTNQDSSFMVDSGSKGIGSTEYYPFSSTSNQFISIVLVPYYTLDFFALAVYNKSGVLMASSTTSIYVNTLQMNVPINTELVVACKLITSAHVLESRYRLYVTGSTAVLNQYNIQGPHVLAWGKTIDDTKTFPFYTPSPSTCYNRK